MLSKIKGAFFGLAVGDALGVPVEFTDRGYLKRNPVVDMIGYGTHNQPAGTWSDDSSLTFCLAESLCNGYNLNEIAANFIKWKYEAYWTPYNKVFDIGISTSEAISRLKLGNSPDISGNNDEKSNGNGSLMRIIPLAFYLINKNDEERFSTINEVSSLTHRHIRSVLACYFYIEYAILLIKGNEKFEAFRNTQKIFIEFISNKKEYISELEHFKRILTENIANYNEEKIYSSGYVIHSLEASMWSVLNNNNLTDTILMAVNLGDDSDTTAAITGALAGIIYGFDNIPEKWIKTLARNNEIENLTLKFSKSLH